MTPLNCKKKTHQKQKFPYFSPFKFPHSTFGIGCLTGFLLKEQKKTFTQFFEFVFVFI